MPNIIKIEGIIKCGTVKSTQRFILEETATMGSYTLKLLNIEEWMKEKKGIKNLGKIIEIFNETNWDPDLAQSARLYGQVLKDAAIKHNSNRWRYLKFLLFPLISKLWGCTLFTTYNQNILIKTINRKKRIPLDKV